MGSDYCNPLARYEALEAENQRLRNQMTETAPRCKPAKAEFACLNRGYLKYIDHLGSDQFIVESARMSTGKGFQGWDKDAGILDFMYSERHSSPFEFGVLVVEVQAPIMVFRQWHRHRTFTYQEASGRYTELPELYYIPSVERMQTQSTVNKQASSGSALDFEVAMNISQLMHSEQNLLREGYKRYLGKGLARELARNNCPVSQYSRMRAIGNLKNWFHFLGLRMDAHAQHEIQVFANAAAEIIKQIWPRTFHLFEEYDLYGKRLSRTEAALVAEALGQGFISLLHERALTRLGEKKALRFMQKFFPEFSPAPATRYFFKENDEVNRVSQ